MVQIGRNDSCPCGSGKKYKKCCGTSSTVVSIEHILGHECFDLQKALLKFAWTDYRLQDYVEDRVPLDKLPREIEEILVFALGNWVIFTNSIDNDGRIIDRFIKQEGKRVKRQRLLEIVQNWSEGRPSISRLVEKDGDLMVIEDLFTKESIRVRILDPEQIDEDVEDNSLLIGILLPFSESELTYFTAFLNFSHDESFDAEEQAINLYHRIGQGRSYEEFVSNSYPELLEALLLDPGPMTLEEFAWADSKQRRVAELLEEKMAGTLSEAYLYPAWTMWYSYCKGAEPIIRKPELYAAAMHYLVLAELFEQVTQKEIAELYDVSATSLSQKYRDLADFLDKELLDLKGRVLDALLDDHNEEEDREEDEESYLESLFQQPHSGGIDTERLIRELHREIEANDFKNMDEVNAFLQSKMGKPIVSPAETDQDRAQDLLFEAFAAKGKKRKTLIEKAKVLDPNNPDVYNLLGDDAKKPEEALAFYKEGMERGEKGLGKAYFKENKGDFWLLIETRPYMRAKENYARALLKAGYSKEALKHFEELLKLNPNDNQGIRYDLIELYLKLEMPKKVDALVKNYPDDFLGEDPFV